MPTRLPSSKSSASITTIFILSLSFLHLSLIHISEPTRQAEISYAVFCLKKKTPITDFVLIQLIDMPVVIQPHNLQL